MQEGEGGAARATIGVDGRRQRFALERRPEPSVRPLQIDIPLAEAAMATDDLSTRARERYARGPSEDPRRARMQR